MDEDKFALVEKIIKDVDNVMSKNAELCSFDIVPVESNFQNKSPVLHLENCLGLESWCVKHVYMYCYTELMDKYVSKPKRKTYKVTSVISDRLTRLLNVTLLLNPDLSSLWNKRREMVLKLFLEKSSELNFTRLVLSRKPKCNDAFAYRRWLLELILQDENIQSNYIENLTNTELQICELASDKSPNNYHSWSHRMWMLNTLKKYEKQFDLSFFFIKEYEFSERWTARHVSDFSCFHYRQFCIKNLFTLSNESWKSFENAINTNLRKSFVRVLALNFPDDATIQVSEDDLINYSEDNLVNLLLTYSAKSCNCVPQNPIVSRKLQVLFHELVLNNELLRFYKHHETLWYHRRYIIHEIMGIMYEYYGLDRQNGALVKNACKKCNLDDMRQSRMKIGRYDGERVYKSVLFKVTLSHEVKFIDERRSDSDNYADRHEKYLKFVEGLNYVI